MMKAAYIHIPFCKQICHYCDFNKFFLKGQPVEDYLTSLEIEMKNTLEQYPTQGLTSIFVGGGTPTALDERQLERLLKGIALHLMPLAGDDLEFTFEANPGDLNEEKLYLLKDAGVNRLSIGVQTFDDVLLERIGRTHRVSDVFKSIELARSAGFTNLSIDLIYGLPNQSLEQFASTLDTALSLGIEHFSGYSLQIEPKTVFYNLMREGRLSLPIQETEAAMYELLMEQMERHGYQQYEISNFSKQRFESRHNLVYWNNEEYYGFGAGAHSYMQKARRVNAGPLTHYISKLEESGFPYVEIHSVPINEQMEEELFLGLRKTAGINIDYFKDKFKLDLLQIFGKQISNLSARELVKIMDNQLVLTHKGKLLGNEVFQAFIGEI